MPIVIPGTNTFLFFMAETIIGTNGGELMSATEDAIIKSASTFIIFDKMTWMNKEKNITKNKNRKIERPSLK